MVISFKTAAGAVATIHKHTYKIVCYGDTAGRRLRVDVAATARGKHDPSKQGRRSIIIYKSYMYSEASLDPGKCTYKLDQKARNQWGHARQIGQFEGVSSPPQNTYDEEIKTEAKGEATGAGEHNTGADPTHRGSGAHALAAGTVQG